MTSRQVYNTDALLLRDIALLPLKTCPCVLKPVQGTRGLLSGKMGTGMCGPDRVLFQPLRFSNGPFFHLKIGLDIGRVFAKCIIFDEFFLWFTYRLSKSTYASQFTL